MKSYSEAGQIQAVLGLVEAIDRGGIDGSRCDRGP